MPTAHRTSAPSFRVAGPAASMLLGGLVASGAVLVGTTAAQGADMTGAISSARRNQIAFEGSMRAMDKQVKTLKRKQKRAKKGLRRSQGRLATAIERRERAAERLTDAQEDLELALLVGPLAGSVLVPVPQRDDPAGSDGGSVALPLVAPIAVEVPNVETDRSSLAMPLRPPVSAAEIEALRTTIASDEGGRPTGRQATAPREEGEALTCSERQDTPATAPRSHRPARAVRGLARRLDQADDRALEASRGEEVQDQAGHARTLVRSTGVRRGHAGATTPGHDGIDYGGWSGAPVRASASGVVAYVGWNPWDKGKRAFVVVIGHASGYETIYGHLLPIRRVRVGQEVRKGQLVGLMGNTGHSTGTHLHFELSRNWRTLNPGYFF